MSDITIILDRKELVVRMDSGAVRIDRPEGGFERIPLNMIERVIVVSSPMVSCSVWRSLAQNYVPVVLLPSRGNKFPTYIGPGMSGSVRTRVAQYQAGNDKYKALNIAKWLLSMKLEGQESVLKTFGKQDPEIEASCLKIKKFCSDMKNADSISSLMGYEGSAAREYFKALAILLPEKFNFSGRNRRPPKDPVNALLSLSYVLAGGEVLKVIHKKGLDPALGLLHSIQEYRENLMLDILEPLRPLTDEFVLRLIDKERLNLNDFIITSEEKGCLLNKSGRKIYYYNWAQWLSDNDEPGNLKKKAEEIVNKLVDFLFDSP